MDILPKRVNSTTQQINALIERTDTILAKYGIKQENKVSMTKNHTEFKLRSSSLRNLRVAAIMDEFTLACYLPECTLLELTPHNWKAEIDNFSPELVFIESAWNGKDKLWYRKIANGSPELYEMCYYCREAGIPIIYWCKEDPRYTDTFMPAAQMADFVFTCDLDCVSKYKRVLEHDRVFFLHFAAQPVLHNPIEKYTRKDKFCFAGAYYHAYKRRSQVFDEFSRHFIKTKGLDIYDRNYQNARPEHAFPTFYEPYILGTLAPQDIDIAYKGYLYGINMNSITQSQSMFARRVYELLASNTVVVGNYSRGVKNIFGDLTICTDDLITLERYLADYCGTETTLRRYRLLGLRKVLQAHLYEDRLDYIVRLVFNRSLKPQLPKVTVVVRKGDLRSEEAFARQSYTEKELLIIDVDNEQRIISEMITKGYVACFREEDHYGDNYLTDIMLTCRYRQADVIGKATHYDYRGGAPERNGDAVYQAVPSLAARRSVASLQVCGSISLGTLLDDWVYTGANCFAVDEFNYAANAPQDSDTSMTDDLFLADQGVSLEQMEAAAERTPVMSLDGTLVLTVKDLNTIKPARGAPVSVTAQADALLLSSRLKENEHSYLTMSNDYITADYSHDGQVSVRFSGTSECEFIGLVQFYDRDGNKLQPVFTKLNRLEHIEIPNKADRFRLGMRLHGKGKTRLKRITIGAEEDEDLFKVFISRSNVLVLTNIYPSANDLYRNMFVHKRLTEYKRDGSVFDVLCMKGRSSEPFREYDGINVLDCDEEALDTALSKSCIDTVCVHFLNEGMWSVLSRYLDKIRLIVWCHGADIQPWWRRMFNYHNQDELDKAKQQSNTIMTMWKNVFNTALHMDCDIHFVFVSQYFASEVMEDYQVELPQKKYSIIHNVIDTELFQYKPKNAEQRTNILTIKPFSSEKYGNDITRDAIIELAKKPFFKELAITIYGSGEQFDELTAPLRKYSNVVLEKRFLTQAEIAHLHKKNGVFIATSRWDSHGVSRDEAMSSGLVPITNAVAAIPEFVDDKCGILVPAEDFRAVAEAIETLYRDPALFLRLSENAAARVRSQTSREYTIEKELCLIKDGKTQRLRTPHEKIIR